MRFIDDPTSREDMLYPDLASDEVEEDIAKISDEVRNSNESNRDEICLYCGSIGPPPGSIHAKTCLCGRTQQKRWKRQ